MTLPTAIQERLVGKKWQRIVLHLVLAVVITLRVGLPESQAAYAAAPPPSVGQATAARTAGDVAQPTLAQAAGDIDPCDIVPIPFESVPPRFPLIDPEAEWGERRRNPAKARAAGLPVTPLRRTVADVLTWDEARGTPDLGIGLTPEEEARLLAGS